MRFLEYVYQIECNDVVIEYTGYPLQAPSMPLITAFPSVLVFHLIPDSIDYEISSKYVADIVRGTIEIRK